MAIYPKKQKTRIEEIRRVELIDAAHRIFLQDGLKGLTTTRICHEAGLSQGILTYYFKDKEEVLFAMVRVANQALMDAVVDGLRQATTRWERLLALIDGSFPADRFERNIANAWVSFYAEAAHNARYGRLQHLFYRRLHSNVAFVLSPVLGKADIDSFVFGMAAMIDGFWLRRGHAGSEFSLDDVRAQLVDYAEKRLGDSIVATLKAMPPGLPVSGEEV